MRDPASGKCLDYLREEVRRGIAQLWHFRDERDEAYAITRTDLNPREFVVCYFQGSGLVKFGRVLRDAAHSRGLTVRAHTSRPGVARMLRSLGASMDEMIFRSAAHG